MDVAVADLLTVGGASAVVTLCMSVLLGALGTRGHAIAPRTLLGLALGFVGVGALIEKTFEGGRTLLQSLGLPVESLACVTSMDNGQVILGDC